MPYRTALAKHRKLNIFYALTGAFMFLIPVWVIAINAGRSTPAWWVAVGVAALYCAGVGWSSAIWWEHRCRKDEHGNIRCDEPKG